jgi:hypothetical protein
LIELSRYWATWKRFPFHNPGKPEAKQEFFNARTRPEIIIEKVSPLFPYRDTALGRQRPACSKSPCGAVGFDRAGRAAYH